MLEQLVFRAPEAYAPSGYNSSYGGVRLSTDAAVVAVAVALVTTDVERARSEKTVRAKFAKSVSCNSSDKVGFLFFSRTHSFHD